MNLKVPPVVSAVTGVTGRAILKAILNGEQDPQKLAHYRDRHCQPSQAALARARQGTGRAEPLVALPQAVELYEFYHPQLSEGDRHIEAHRQTFADKSAGQGLP
jgi:transposase